MGCEALRVIEFFEQVVQSGRIDFGGGTGVAIKHEALARESKEVEWGRRRGCQVRVAMAGVAGWVRGSRFEPCDSNGFGGAAEDLGDARSGDGWRARIGGRLRSRGIQNQRLQYGGVLAGSEVALEDEVGSGAQELADERKKNREARIAQLARLAGIVRAEDVEERLFDSVFAKDRHTVSRGQHTRERGLTRAGETRDQYEMSLAHYGECATLSEPGAIHKACPL